MSQTYPLGSFKWVEETTRFNEDFINSYDEDSDIEYLLIFNMQKNCMKLIIIYTFSWKE